MNKMLCGLGLVFALMPVHSADSSFFREVAKGVAVNVLTEVLKSAYSAATQPNVKSREQILERLPQTIDGSADDSRRVRAIIASLTDTTSPLEERIGLYAAKVDYFSSGVVDHSFILKDRRYFESRWPERSYKIISIDEVSVDPDRKFAAARYTLRYEVARIGDRKSGTSKVAVLLGSFDSQPRIYAIKEWVHRD